MAIHKKRNQQVWGIQGRPKRKLLWRKEIYEEWFYWMKLAGEYPEEFGPLNELSLAKWWRHIDYGFELFCEPYEEPPAKIVGEGDEVIADKDTLTVSMNLTRSQDEVLGMVQSFINQKYKNRKQKEAKSQAKKRPSKAMKFLKAEKFERYRLVYEMKTDKKKKWENADIYEKLRKKKSRYQNKILRRIEKQNEERGIDIKIDTKVCFFSTVDRKTGEVTAGEPYVTDNMSRLDRTINRDYQRALAIIENVKKGIFP